MWISCSVFWPRWKGAPGRKSLRLGGSLRLGSDLPSRGQQLKRSVESLDSVASQGSRPGMESEYSFCFLVAHEPMLNTFWPWRLPTSSVLIPLINLRNIFFTPSKTTRPVVKLPSAPCKKLLASSWPRWLFQKPGTTIRKIIKYNKSCTFPTRPTQ